MLACNTLNSNGCIIDTVSFSSCINSNVVINKGDDMSCGSIVGSPYKDTVGLSVKLYVCYDLTTVTTRNIIVKKPDGTKVTWIAQAMQDENGEHYLAYTTVSGDLDQSGMYELQAEVISSTVKLYGNSVKLVVQEQFT